MSVLMTRRRHDFRRHDFCRRARTSMPFPAASMQGKCQPRSQHADRFLDADAYL